MQDHGVARPQDRVLGAGGYFRQGAIKVEQEKNVTLRRDQRVKAGRQFLWHGTQRSGIPAQAVLAVARRA